MSHSGANYFHTDSIQTMQWLRSVLDEAIGQGQSIRLYTIGGGLMVKRGGGMWSSLIESTPDSARDTEAVFTS